MLLPTSIAEQMIKAGTLLWNDYFIDLDGGYYITRNKLKQMYS